MNQIVKHSIGSIEGVSKLTITYRGFANKLITDSTLISDGHLPVILESLLEERATRYPRFLYWSNVKSKFFSNQQGLVDEIYYFSGQEIFITTGVVLRPDTKKVLNQVLREIIYATKFLMYRLARKMRS